jgi:hypothetical protein
MTNTTPPPIPPKSPELAVLIAAVTALVQALGVLLVALSDVPAALRVVVACAVVVATIAAGFLIRAKVVPMDTLERWVPTIAELLQRRKA